MRRRRQKNTLLPKTIGVAVVITAILLPILAQLGAFKNIGGQKLTQVELIKLPPPEKRPTAPKKMARKPTAKPKAAGHKTAARAAPRRAPSGPPPVKVVAAGPAPGASGGAGGDAGITGSENGTTPPVPPPPAPPAPAAPPIPPPAPVPPAPAPPAPKPAPLTPLPEPSPVITAAVPVSQPKPSIPDDLRDNDLNASFNALFTIQADGSASVRMVSSTGNPALDALALDAAKRWTFRPATRNGQPVQSFLRLRVEFDVTS